MRYDSLTYDELERLHTADPNNVNVAIALAAAAKQRIVELEGEVEELKAEMKENELLDTIRDLID